MKKLFTDSSQQAMICLDKTFQLKADNHYHTTSSTCNLKFESAKISDIYLIDVTDL